jgi:hypothetical protein
MPKRGASEAFDEEDLMQIKVAESLEYIMADPCVVMAMSQCARSLPMKDTWDLSTFLVQERPVTRSTVISWLNLAYNVINCCDFETLPAEATAADLSLLLAFADAVNSKKSLLDACLAKHLPCLRFHINLGEKEVQLQTDRIYYFSPKSPLQLLEGQLTAVSILAAASSEEQKAAFLSQLAAQLEHLLFLSLKLNLLTLLQKLQGFIRLGTGFGSSNNFLRPITDEIFTSRVLDAAAGRKLGKESLSSSIIGVNLWQMLTPVNMPAELESRLKFEATLNSDLTGLPKGSVVPVILRLTGSKGPTVKIGIHAFGLQLRLAYGDAS